MKNRATQFVSSLMAGGSLGTFLALLLSPKFGAWSAVLGVFVGSLFCYLSYRPRETASAFMHALRFVAPRAWNMLTVSAPACIRQMCQYPVPGWLGSIAFFAMIAGFPLIVSIYTPDDVTLGLQWSVIASNVLACGAVAAMVGMISMVATLLSPLVAMLALSLDSFESAYTLGCFYNKMLVDVSEGIEKPWSWSFQTNSIFMLVTMPFVVIYAVFQAVIKICSVLVKALILVLSTTLKVLYRTFVMIHSSARVIVSVDGGVGVLLTYVIARQMYGSAFLDLSLATQCTWSVAGGIAAVAIGLANAYLVAPVLGYRPLFQKG